MIYSFHTIVEDEDTEERESPYFEYSGEIKRSFADAGLNLMEAVNWDRTIEGRDWWADIHSALVKLAAGKVEKAKEKCSKCGRPQ